MNHVDFMQAVLIDPADDGPRLVYADWLEERGDPRGEFIRLQCAIARFPVGLVGLAREQVNDAPTLSASIGPQEVAVFDLLVPLVEREGELLDRHGEEWSHPIAYACWCSADPAPSAIGRSLGWWAADFAEYTRWQFRRGFVAALVVSAETLLACSRALTAFPLEEVDLTTVPNRCRDNVKFLEGFAGDAEARMFTKEDLAAVYREGDTAVDTMLRCRWPGISFTRPFEVSEWEIVNRGPTTPEQLQRIRARMTNATVRIERFVGP